jgi:GT2 family glycosyltransferase
VIAPAPKSAADARSRIGVVIASLGRPEECMDLLRRIARQSHKAAAIVLSVEGEADLPSSMPDGITVVMGPRGSCAQRNRGVEAIRGQCDAIAYFDDDYVPSVNALEAIAKLFDAEPDVVGVTGQVLADGVGRGGVALEDAERIVDLYDAAWPPRDEQVDLTWAYGCNMAFRAAPMEKVAFDERLSLYGWQEDVDYAGQMLSFGRIVRSNRLGGVHRGVSHGRTSGVRLGFSQVVNPLYLIRKRTMGWRHGFRILLKNIMINHIRYLWPEPHIDRRGRAHGNWLAILHVIRGNLNPECVIEIQ